MSGFCTRAIALVVSGAAQIGFADTLELRNGTVMDGKFAGGTATTVRFETAGGVQVVPTTDVLAVTFSTAAMNIPPVPPAPTPAPAPAASATVPAGTVLTIRMDSQVSSNDAAGKKFSAKLLANLMAGDVVVAPAGATVYGQVEKSEQAGRLAGKSKLAMSLTGIDMNGTIQPIMTTNFSEQGTGEGKKTVRNVAAGAVIGNAVGGNDGGKKGAAVGAGVSLIKKGDSVTVPPGAILEFRLTQPFTR